MNWIEVDDIEDHNFYDGEIVLCADEISGLVTLGKLNPEGIDLMHIEPMEIDVTVTHVMKRPLPPVYNENPF